MRKIYLGFLLITLGFGISACQPADSDQEGVRRDLVNALNENTKAVKEQTAKLNQIETALNGTIGAHRGTQKLMQTLDASIRGDIGAHRGTQKSLQASTVATDTLSKSVNSLESALATSRAPFTFGNGNTDIDACYSEQACQQLVETRCRNIGYGNAFRVVPTGQSGGPMRQWICYGAIEN